jgi:hypothetical protein
VQGWSLGTVSTEPSDHQILTVVVQWPEAGHVGGVVAYAAPSARV